VTSGASGTVIGGGINCGSTCQIAVDAGTSVELVAAGASGYYFGGWSGGGCSGGALSCKTQALTADTTVNAKFTSPNVIFTSSATYTVDQLRAHDPMAANDAVRGADQYCKDLAASGTGPNLGGRKWTSLLAHGTTVSTATWTTRVAGLRGWVRVDGKPFGDTVESIHTNYVVYYPPSLDENGRRLAGNSNNFVVAGSGCNDWTTGDMTARRGAGVPTGGAFGWINAYGISCSAAEHLYCLSTDYTATVTVTAPVAGRKWFVSDTSFKPGAGQSLTTADALCQSDASKAGFSGTFKALMASTSPATTAIARMNLSGTPWVRPDGVPVVAAAADLNVAEPVLLSAPQVTASKKYGGNVWVWTGATSATATPTAATTCTPSGAASWTGGDPATGYMGETFFADYWYFYSASTSNCNSAAPVYCLEQ